MNSKHLWNYLAVAAVLLMPALGQTAPAVPPGAADAIAVGLPGGEGESIIASDSAPEPASEGDEQSISASFSVLKLPGTLPLNTLWVAFLLEPGTGVISDRLELSLDDTSTNNAFFTLTLFSDPSVSAEPCPNAQQCATEDGTMQNMTNFLLSAGVPFGEFFEFIQPVNIYAFSDADASVPEPGTLTLLVLGLLGFGFGRRELT